MTCDPVEAAPGRLWAGTGSFSMLAPATDPWSVSTGARLGLRDVGHRDGDRPRQPALRLHPDGDLRLRLPQVNLSCSIGLTVECCECSIGLPVEEAVSGTAVGTIGEPQCDHRCIIVP